MRSATRFFFYLLATLTLSGQAFAVTEQFSQSTPLFECASSVASAPSFRIFFTEEYKLKSKNRLSNTELEELMRKKGPRRTYFQIFEKDAASQAWITDKSFRIKPLTYINALSTGYSYRNFGHGKRQLVLTHEQGFFRAAGRIDIVITTFDRQPDIAPEVSTFNVNWTYRPEGRKRRVSTSSGAEYQCQKLNHPSQSVAQSDDESEENP